MLPLAGTRLRAGEVPGDLKLTRKRVDVIAGLKDVRPADGCVLPCRRAAAAGTATRRHHMLLGMVWGRKRTGEGSDPSVKSKVG
jgi:hypothetical protein